MDRHINRKPELQPDTLVKQISERKEVLEQFLNIKTKALKTAPDGFLRVAKKHNSRQYYHRTGRSKYESVYLNRNQYKLAASLAQKDYDCKLIAELKAEIKILKGFFISYQPKRIEEIYSSLHECRKPLVRPVIIPDEDYAREWMNFEYMKKKFDDGAPEYYTAKGERVRSKSELIIADTLNRFNIPYRYECPIESSGNGTIHPDFSCLNVRTRKEFLWEHNGMMSDSEYADYAIRRIEMYALDGYFLGENLLLTFETSSRPLNSRIIECYIRKFLI
jgi:hypothetical protein